MLINLTPGITNNSTTSSTGLIDIDSVSYSSANGADRHQNEFLMDGIPNNVSDRVAYIPSVDMVEEFSVQTNALDAEYGHGGGMYVNVTTKGGTNQFPGNLWEFVRNDKLNANSFFANRAGAKRPVFRFNQFGLAVGGPVIKDKVFWFFNWEGLRQRTPFTYRITVPTALQRQGDFSQTLDRTGAAFLIADPLTTAPTATGGQARTLFPGERSPASRINPIAANVIKRYPEANGPGDPFTNANNYFAVVPLPMMATITRCASIPTSNGIACSPAGRTTTASGTPTVWDIGGGVGALEGNNRAQSSIGLSDVWTLSPSLVLTAKPASPGGPNKAAIPRSIRPRSASLLRSRHSCSRPSFPASTSPTTTSALPKASGSSTPTRFPSTSA